MKDYIKNVDRIDLDFLQIDCLKKQVKRKIKLHALYIFLFTSSFLGYFIHIANNFMR